MTKKILEMFSKNAPSEKEEEKASASQQAPAVTEPAPAESVPDEKALRAEIEELLELFPKLKAQAVPQEVWQRVEKGDSLSAAYCLWLVKSIKEKNRISKVNDKNMKAAPPKLLSDSAAEEFFTRDTVKNMSKEQVRKNLDKILSSMDSWK